MGKTTHQLKPHSPVHTAAQPPIHPGPRGINPQRPRARVDGIERQPHQSPDIAHPSPRVPPDDRAHLVLVLVLVLGIGKRRSRARFEEVERCLEERHLYGVACDVVEGEVAA